MSILMNSVTLNIFYGNHLYLRISKWGVTLGQSSSELLQFKVEGLEIEYYENVFFNFFSFQAVTTYLYTAITQNCFGLQRCYNPFWKFWNKQKQGEKSSKWTKLVSQIKRLL